MHGTYSHFTRDAISLSREEAIRLGHDAIQPEHLLLGILRLGAGTAIDVLHDLGADMDALRDEVEGAMEPGSATDRNIPLAPQAEYALKAAVNEARRYKSAIVSTEHLLLSLFQLQDHPVAHLVRGHCGATYESACRALDNHLGLDTPTPTDVPSDTPATTPAPPASTLDDLLAAFDETIFNRISVIEPVPAWRTPDAIEEPEDRIAVEVVAVDALAGQDSTYDLVLREKHGARLMSIKIGPFDAQAINAERKEVRPPRPTTHDLMLHLAEAGGLTVREVCIDAWHQDTCCSYLVVVRQDQETRLDARPSDAVALAVRVGCPISVSRQVFEQAIT